MHTIVVAVVLIVSSVKPAPLCPASEWRASGVASVQVRDLGACK